MALKAISKLPLLINLMPITVMIFLQTILSCLSPTKKEL